MRRFIYRTSSLLGRSTRVNTAQYLTELTDQCPTNMIEDDLASCSATSKDILPITHFHENSCVRCCLSDVSSRCMGMTMGMSSGGEQDFYATTSGDETTTVATVEAPATVSTVDALHGASCPFNTQPEFITCVHCALVPEVSTHIALSQLNNFRFFPLFMFKLTSSSTLILLDHCVLVFYTF